MDFGEAFESTQLAEKWLSENYITPEGTSEAVMNVLTQKVAFMVEINDTNAGIINQDPKKCFKDSVEKYCFFNDIKNVLEKNMDLIIQLEMCIRGFSKKDSMKLWQLFLNYFDTYSSITPSEEVDVFLYKLPSKTPLSFVGFVIAHCLCFNEEVNIICGPKLCVILSAIKQILNSICEKYGIGINIYASKNCSTISGKTPFILFNDCDLHSACESIIKAAFSYQGQMHWSANTVFVQDAIFDQTVTKLKQLFNNIRIGAANDKQIDFSFPYLIDNFESNFTTVINDAKTKGIEVYQPESGNNKFSPLLLTGGKLYNNNVIKPNEPCVPYINVLGFRNIKEGIALCNNQQQSFAATVWCNNLALTNEIVHNLNVGTVWINTHDIFNTNVPFTLFENGPIIGTLNNYEDRSSNYLTDEKELKIISKIKTAQVSWNKETTNKRMKTLQSVAIKLNSFDKKANPLVTKWQNALINVNLKELASSNVQVYGSVELKQFREPKGIIYFNDNTENLEKYVISALRIGNSVLLNNAVVKNCDKTRAIVEEISNQLPGGVLNILDCSNMSEEGLLQFTHAYSDLVSFSNYKNIWSSVGENYV